MVLQNSSTLKNQKPMILMEFIKNIVTICFPIPKSVIKREKVKKKSDIDFFSPFRPLCIGDFTPKFSIRLLKICIIWTLDMQSKK